MADKQGVVKERFGSANLPLGIDADCPVNVPPRHFRWTQGDQLVLCSDGLLEAQSPGGEAFGSPRLEAVLRDTLPTQRNATMRCARRSTCIWTGHRRTTTCP